MPPAFYNIRTLSLCWQMNISKTTWINVMPELAGWKKLMCTGLSKNILHVGDKSPVQRGFFHK